MWKKLPLGVLAVLLFAPASIKAGDDSAVVQNPGPNLSNFDNDTAETNKKVKELLSQFRLSKFYYATNKAIEAQDAKGLEKLVQEQVEESPEFKTSSDYHGMLSRIAFLNGDYQTAYTEANQIVTNIENYLAPHKPYELTFLPENEDAREGIRASYILRYQAEAWLYRNDDALADINHALQMKPAADVMRAKTELLIILGNYKEAAEAADQTYAMDTNIFAQWNANGYYCGALSKNGYNVKACSVTTAKKSDSGVEPK
jgi:hypothetical protein